MDMAAETATQIAADRNRNVGGNVAKLVDRLSKDLSAATKPGIGSPPEIALRKERVPGGFRKARVRFSYNPKESDELELQVDDVIDILEEAEEGWFKGKLKGKTGLFPANFVEVSTVSVASEEETQPEQNGAGDSSATETGVIQPKKVRGIGFGVDILGGGAVNLRPVKAAGGKDAERKTTIEFIEKDGSAMKPTTSLSTESLGSKMNSGKDTREYARVEFKYDSKNEDELVLEVGEIVTVLSKDCEDAGWWYGELNGKKGVFPDNFVKIIPLDQVPKEKKVTTVQPPAVPAKPKPVGHTSSLGRSTTPEPHKQDRVVLDLGQKANSLKGSSGQPASAAHSVTTDSKKEEPAPDKPKKPAFPSSLTAGLAKSRAPQPNVSATPSAAKSQPLHESHTEKDEGSDTLPEIGAERLMHPTASRPKHPKKRPPSQVFLSQMGKDVSPTTDEQPSSPLSSSSPSSVLPVFPPPVKRAPIKPPPPHFNVPPSTANTISIGSVGESSTDSSLPKQFRLNDEVKTVIGDSGKKMVSLEDFLEHKKECEAYRRETSARIAQLEKQIEKLTQESTEKL